jgi:hypothetical protein
MHEITFGELVHLTLDSVLRFAQNDKRLGSEETGDEEFINGTFFGYYLPLY